MNEPCELQHLLLLSTCKGTNYEEINKIWLIIYNENGGFFHGESFWEGKMRNYLLGACFSRANLVKKFFVRFLDSRETIFLVIREIRGDKYTRRRVSVSSRLILLIVCPRITGIYTEVLSTDYTDYTDFLTRRRKGRRVFCCQLIIRITLIFLVILVIRGDM